MKSVLDTSVLVSAVRSPAGASAHLVALALRGELEILASVPLFVEYEAVLTRDEHLRAAGAHVHDIVNLLDALASVVVPVDVTFLWRPQLRDPNDDMVLEAAVNGRAKAVVTFNPRDFAGMTVMFGIEVLLPADLAKRL